MHVLSRGYKKEQDFERISQFLVRTYSMCGRHVNWLQPRWEYMHFHPLIREIDLAVIGVWEADGRIVAVVHPEHAIGTAYFEMDPNYSYLKEDMLRHAEEKIATSYNGVRFLQIYINDADEELRDIASGLGYVKTDKCEPMSHFPIPSVFPSVRAPDGFRLLSLDKNNNLEKIGRVLYRGFNHGDTPLPGDVADRRFMQSAPNFRGDLNIVVQAQNGDFVSYCGIWYEPVHRIAYVEPVATDPDYRRLGLGRAAVLEGIRRCSAVGAKVACVGTAKPFYVSLGFKQVYNRSAWRKELTQ